MSFDICLEISRNVVWNGKKSKTMSSAHLDISLWTDIHLKLESEKHCGLWSREVNHGQTVAEGPLPSTTLFQSLFMAHLLYSPG